ncbi:cytochrome b5 domain-containing protein [Geoalkalibacter subterraneus]|uniref:cytochrome b5 domain-containing protein n=1 Tax=Geoalkalibacter subterraneus TaxID=483547 RepID=UPI00069441FC|nr:cytochrome b5 domain-containing protein [Geoalkalibacter subterraneus]
MKLSELSNFDGRGGNNAYVAVSGKVYDVSESELWQNGDHQGQHQAGADLTEELGSAPHVRAVVERFPVVDHVEEPEPEKKKKGLFGLFGKG